MRRPYVPALAALATAAAMAGSALGATRTIAVGDNWFVRSAGVPDVSVKRGTLVSWRFVGDRVHDVQVQDGPVRFRSPVRRSGTFRKRIWTAGRYVIICSIHGGRDQKMVLRVRR